MIVKLENGKEVDIQRLPLGRYADLLQQLQELPKHIEEFRGMDEKNIEDFVPMLPKLIGQCLPDFLRIIPIATPITTEEVDNLELGDLIEIVKVVIEVNNFQSAFEKIKKYLAQRNQSLPSQPQS